MKPAQKSDLRRLKKELTGGITIGGGGNLMLKPIYDMNNDGVVDKAAELTNTKFRIAEVNGDLWLTANAYWTGSVWNRIDIAKVAFAIQMQGANNIPGEGVQGLNIWVAQPGNNPIGDFAAMGGWEAGFIITGYGTAVLGSNVLEFDGYGLVPYGRFIHSHVLTLGYDYTGILTNLFGDLSGVDDITSPSWFLGRIKHIDSGAERISVQVAQPGSTNLSEKAYILSDGSLYVPKIYLTGAGYYLNSLVGNNKVEDSDKLDGNHAADFAAASHIHDVVSASANGFMLKLPNDNGKFYNGIGSWVELVAAAGQIALLSVVSDNERHNNSAEKSVTETSATKKKEIIFNEPAKNIRVKWEMRISDMTGAKIYGAVFVNGTIKSGWFNTDSSTYTGFSFDLTDKLNAGDKVQIYCYCSQAPTDIAQIRNMKLSYDRAICGFGDYTLVSPLPVNEFTEYDYTDSDPA